MGGAADLTPRAGWGEKARAAGGAARVERAAARARQVAVVFMVGGGGGGGMDVCIIYNFCRGRGALRACGNDVVVK